MHDNPDLLGQLRAEWRRTGHSPAAVRGARELIARHPECRWEGVEDLCGVVDALERRGGRTVEQRAQIVQALLEDAANPLVHRTLLQTLLPGTVSVCRQLQFGRGVCQNPSEALDEALSMLSELLTDWAGQSRPYAAPDLLSALRGRLRRWLLKEKAQRATGAVAVDETAPENSPLLRRLNELAHGPHARLATLTYARVFEGRPLNELARLDHTSPVALQTELRQFATRFLL